MNHRGENAISHGGDDLIEPNWRRHLYTESFQVARIRVIGILTDRRIGPRSGSIPTMSGDANTPDFCPDYLHSLQNALHLAPPEPVISDVEHAIALLLKVKRYRPCWVVSVKKKWLHIGSQRMQGWLIDFIRQALADMNRDSARRCIDMIVITYHSNRIVEFSIAIDYDSTSARHPTD